MRYRHLLSFIVFFWFSLTSVSLVAADLASRVAAVTESAEMAERIVNELQSQTVSQLLAEDFLVMAVGFQTLGNREAALEAVIKAENLAKTPYELGIALYTKARIYGIMYQDAPMALQQLTLAEQQLVGLKEDLNAADVNILLTDVYNSFASAYNLQGDLKNALTYAQRSLALAQKINNDARQLQALILNGRITLQNNQYQLAFSYLQQALFLASQLQDAEQLASIHYRLGMAHRKLDQHTDALEHFTAAAERYSALNRMANYSLVLI